jgi:hypothetical protein
VKSLNCTGFFKKKNSETLHVNSASKLIHSHWFFEILKIKKKNLFTLMNSYSGASFISVHDKAHKPLPFNIMVPQTRSARQI